MKCKLFGDTNYQNMYVIVLVTMVILTTSSMADDCYYKPCQKYGKHDKSCQFNIGCKREGSFSKCDVSSMHLEKPTLGQSQSKCIMPGLVPGFKDFCKDLLYNTSQALPGPANINNDDVTNFPTGDIIHESKMVADNQCFGTAVLASVASGCFLAGGFVVWLLIFCCRLSVCQCSPPKEEVVVDGGTNPSSWNPLSRGREIGSTSSAQLLANASMESTSTHNTLLSASEGQTSNGISTPGPSSTAHSRASSATWTGQGRPQFGHSRCPSAPWTETGGPLLPNSRSRSAQWTDPGRMSLSRSHAPASQWNDAGQFSLPRSNAESMSWISQGQPHFANQFHSQSAPWLDTIYSPESESSSRDYQSIHGGSENPYAPCSESSSDYSAPQTHRVLIIHDGEIYQPSSESSGSNNDYTSLKGQRFSRPNESIYYPTSEGSNKDYASLANERDDAMAGASGRNFERMNTSIQRDGEEHGNNVKFNVNGLTMPNQTSFKSNRGWTSNLQEINEYETVGTTKKGTENAIDVSNVRTLADMSDINHNTESYVQPHEYFTLEALQNQGR